MTGNGALVGYWAARWLCYLAVFLVVGAWVFRSIVARRIPEPARADVESARDRAVFIARLAAVVLALALLARFYFQTRSLIEPEEPITPEIIRLVIGSRWGHGWLAQTGAALATLIGWRALGRSSTSRTGTWLTTLGCLGLVLATPLTGHAVGLPAAGVIGYPLDVIHVASGATWLGTLGIILLAALRPGGALAPGDLIAAYSPVALVAGLSTIGAGLVIAWRYVGTLAALTGTPYGQTLLIKVATLAGVAATGAYNWRVVLPRLKRGQPAPIARTATVETIVGLLLLAVTAVLVSLGAPGEHPE